jgi:hypothetical protein
MNENLFVCWFTLEFEPVRKVKQFGFWDHTIAIKKFVNNCSQFALGDWYVQCPIFWELRP